MTRFGRSTTISWLFFLGVLVLAGTSRAQTRPSEVEQIAKTYGLDSYGQIEAVRYTFQPRSTGFESESLPYLDLGAQNRPGHVRNKRQGRQNRSRLPTNRSQLNSAPANVKDEIEPAFRERQLLVYLPFPRLLGHQR